MSQTQTEQRHEVERQRRGGDEQREGEERGEEAAARSEPRGQRRHRQRAQDQPVGVRRLNHRSRGGRKRPLLHHPWHQERHSRGGQHRHPETRQDGDEGEDAALGLAIRHLVPSPFALLQA
nr:hypothetical protein [Methylorubrum sp. Q1]